MSNFDVTISNNKALIRDVTRVYTQSEHLVGVPTLSNAVAYLKPVALEKGQKSIAGEMDRYFCTIIVWKYRYTIVL